MRLRHLIYTLLCLSSPGLWALEALGEIKADNVARDDLLLSTDDTETTLTQLKGRLPDEVNLRHVIPRGQGKEDAYQSSGARLGAFTFLPLLTLEAVATDNANEARTNREAETGIRYAPEIELNSNWSRHSLSIKAKGEQILYSGASHNNASDGLVESKLRLDLLKTTSVDLMLSAGKSQSAPGSNEVPDSAIGRRDDYEYSVSGTVDQNFGMFRFAAGGSVTRHTYGDLKLYSGSIEDNGDRNYTELEQSLELGFTPDAIIHPLAQLTFVQIDHDANSDRSGLNRDSSGIRIRAGAEVDMDDLWSGRAGLQYEKRIYRDRKFEDFGGAGIFADMTWRPSPLTTLTFAAASELDESAETGVSGTRIHSLDVKIDHSLRDNLAARGEGGVEYSRSVGSGERSFKWDGKLGLTYNITGALALVADYEFTRQLSDGNETEYYENRIMAGMTFAP